MKQSPSKLLITLKQSLLTFLLTVTAVAGMYAQAPAGTYYQTADGKCGAELKTALCTIILPHVQRTYGDLWTDFAYTDLRPDGYIWDMYSGVTNYVLGTDQNTGNTGDEGKNYNREHSMPNSWFNKDYPPYTDLFHMYPTDSYVNNTRGNNPFGEVGTPTWQSAEGFSKQGPARDGLGYQGVVFEPNDEYKGDFARTYFYMVTCYETYTNSQGQQRRVAGWNSPMLAQNQYPALTTWAVEMLLRWSEQDPVSKKETDRNEAVYGIQHNRNPFIDYPGLEQHIWGDKQSVPFVYDQYGNSILELQHTADAVGTPVFDLGGRRMDGSSLPKGIYIRGGRKFVVR